MTATAQRTAADRKAARLALVEEHARLEVAHDLDALVATFGEHAHWLDQSASQEHPGRDAVRAYYADLFGGFPDFTLDIVRRHVGDETVVLEVLVRGTHTGTWRGIAPTGNRVEFPVCAIFTFDAHDRIEAEIAYFDRLTVLNQLGVM